MGVQLQTRKQSDTTKQIQIDVELSGEIDEQTTTTSEQSNPGMSVPVPLNISQPVVKEWFAKKRANIRPLGTFFNTAHFQVPPSAGRLSKRLYKNVEYFQSNYMLVFLVLVLYCLISSPLLLLVIAAAGGASYYASSKNSERKLAIAGKEVSLAQQYVLFPFSCGLEQVVSCSGCWGPPCSSSLPTLLSTTMMPWMWLKTRSPWLVPLWRRSESWI